MPAPPYGTWLQLYDDWGGFVEGLWPMLEDAFQGELDFNDAVLTAKWDTFFSTWSVQVQSILDEWLTWPVWSARSEWCHLLLAWRVRVQDFRGLLYVFTSPANRVPELWPDVRAWLQSFRLWREQLRDMVAVCTEIASAPADTAAWQRFRRWPEQIRVWMERAQTPIRELMKRVQVFGREWDVRVQMQWWVWSHASLRWTGDIYHLWEQLWTLALK